MQALVSIHDVMPQTLRRVDALIERLPSALRRGLVLLIVPGLEWRPEQIRQLGRWQQQGIELAGHGWVHDTDAIESWYHRLHALLISRTAAEHLSLTGAEIAILLEHNHNWFTRKGLEAPELYVPPAWALGSISPAALAAAPFRYFETSTGLYDSQTRQHRFLPLAGFEADTRLRQFAVSGWNGLNRQLANQGHPLRLAIHPYDAELLLKNSLDKYLDELTETLDYRALFTETSDLALSET